MERAASLLQLAWPEAVGASDSSSTVGVILGQRIRPPCPCCTSAGTCRAVAVGREGRKLLHDKQYCPKSVHEKACALETSFCFSVISCYMLGPNDDSALRSSRCSCSCFRCAGRCSVEGLLYSLDLADETYSQFHPSARGKRLKLRIRHVGQSTGSSNWSAPIVRTDPRFNLRWAFAAGADMPRHLLNVHAIQMPFGNDVLYSACHILRSRLRLSRQTAS